MGDVVKETWVYMFRSSKNRLFMTLITVVALIYSIFVLPNISSDEEVDVQALQRSMEGNLVQFEDSLEEGMIVPSVMTGTTAYYTYRQSYVQQRELLTAIEQGDVYRYLQSDYRRTYEPVTDQQSGIESLVYSIFAYDEEEHFKEHKYNEYINNEANLSFHTVSSRTSLQQLHLFLLGMGPVLLLIGLIFMISDIHTKDTSLKTQKIGLPITWQKYLTVQSLSALAFVTLFYIALFAIIFIIIGIQFGFGHLDLPIGFYDSAVGGIYNLESFTTQTIGWFFLKSVPFILLLVLIVTRMNTLLSLWTKQSIVTMVVGIFLIVAQFIYLGSDTTEFLGFDTTLIPQTYINFGSIITGYYEMDRNLVHPGLYQRGLLVLGITFVLIEILIYISSKRISRQKFES